MWVQVPPSHPSHLVIRTQLERPAFTSPASSLGRTLPRFLSATVAEIAKPEDGRLSGFVLLPRYLTEWRCLTSQDDVGTGGAEAY